MDCDRQPSLFNTHALGMARKTDPDTSHEAAWVIAPKLNHLRKVVYDALATFPNGATDEELDAVCKLSESTTRKRRGELVEMGLVRFSGRYGATAAGNKCRVWEVVK